MNEMMHTLPRHVGSTGHRLRWLRSLFNISLPLNVTVALLSVMMALGLASVVRAEGPDAVAYLPGWDAQTLVDDDPAGSTEAALPAPIHFLGTTYNTVFVNRNGGLTLGGPLAGIFFQPTQIGGVGVPILAPFYSIIESSAQGSDATRFGTVTFEGRPAFSAIWGDPGTGNGVASTAFTINNIAQQRNKFQVLIVDRSDTGTGNFDLVFNYDKIQWDISDRCGDGCNFVASAGYSNGTDSGIPTATLAAATEALAVVIAGPTTTYELPGSGQAGQFLDTTGELPNPSALTRNSKNSTQLGRYKFEFRGGFETFSGSVSGRVTGPAPGSPAGPAVPVAFARIFVCPSFSNLGRFIGGPCVEALTDAAGLFEITGLPDQEYTLEVQPADGSPYAYFFSEGSAFTIADGSAQVLNPVLTLLPTGSIAGRVTTDDATPTPIANAYVSACSLAMECLAATTDADGNYVIGLVPDGEYVITAYTGANSAAIGPVFVTSGGPLTGQDLRIGVPTGRMTGRVTRVSDGSPVANAPVAACGGLGWNCVNGTTDANGNYTLVGLPDGFYQLTAYPPSGSSLLEKSLGGISLIGGGSVTQDIALAEPQPIAPGVDISPRFGGSGNPTVYWQNTLNLTRQACPGGSAFYRIVQNDVEVRSGVMSEGPAGTYTASIPPVYPLHGAVTVEITVQCPDSSTSTTAFDLYIDPSGVVTDTDGNPIPGATVRLFRSDTPFGPFIEVPNGDAIMSPSNRNNPDVTDAVGHYGWLTIPGFYKVIASKAGYTTVESRIVQIGPEVTDLNLVLALGSTDSNPPVITHPNGVTVEAECAQTAVTFAVSALDPENPSAAIVVTCVPASGSLFPVGETTVNCTASDPAGNIATASFVVRVVDTTPPSLLPPAALIVGTGPGGGATVFVPDASLAGSATDLCAPLTVVATGIPPGNLFPIGVTTVTHTATDASGNSVERLQTVTVNDTTPPVLTAPAGLTLSAGADCTVFVSEIQLGVPAATDNSGAAPTIVRTGVPPGNSFPIGTTTIQYRASDGAGNFSTEVQVVTVTGSGGAQPTATASLTRVKRNRWESGDFRVGMSGTPGCGSASVTTTGVMEIPAGTSGYSVRFSRKMGSTSKIEFNHRSRRVNLEGSDPSALNALLAQIIAQGGASVSDGQVLDLERECHEESKLVFKQGVLVSVESDLLRLRVTVRSGTATATATATPRFESNSRHDD